MHDYPTTIALRREIAKFNTRRTGPDSKLLHVSLTNKEFAMECAESKKQHVNVLLPTTRRIARLGVSFLECFSDRAVN